MNGELSMFIEPVPQAGFVETEATKEITERALTYLEVGYPVHFQGRTGTGKTTLAMHVARQIGRKTLLLHGDEALTTADLVGNAQGYRRRRVVDNFIHSVLKTEENMTHKWDENQLTLAIKHGATLIYDEFTRSRPETNNILLSVFEEKILDMQSVGKGRNMRVHPDFQAIFTSNPEEYAGTHETQEALRDRMITFDLEDMDRDTEVAITTAKTGLERGDAERIVALIRDIRSNEVCAYLPTIRACVMLGKALSLKQIPVDASNALFRQFCMDILSSQTRRADIHQRGSRVKNIISGLLEKYCAPNSEPIGEELREASDEK